MPRALDRLEDRLDRLLAGAEVGREAAFVTDGRREAPLLEQRLQRVEDLGRDPQPLGERLRSARDDHELLEIERVRRVRASVDDVQHRHRQHVRLGAAHPAVERDACVRRRGLGGRKRRTEDRIRAEAGLVLGAVERDESSVDRALVGRVEAEECRPDLVAHVPDRLADALAEILLRIAVAELDRLEAAGRGARGNRSPADGAGTELDVDLDRRVTPRVEDLPSPYGGDLAAHSSSFARSK